MGNDPTDRELELQRRSAEEIRLGFVEQDVGVSRLAGCEFTLGRREGSTESAPFERPVAIIGSTELDGRAGELGVADLQDYLTGRGYECPRATAVDADRTWADDCVIIAHVEVAELHAAALAHGQAFVLVWNCAASEAGVMRLVELNGDLEGRLVAEFSPVLRRLDVRPCPVLRDARPGDVCRMHGGPWVSRSIRAVATWERRRARMVRALGCDTCANGSFTIVRKQLMHGRRAVLVAPQPPASGRYQRAMGVDLGEAEPDRDVDGESSGRE